MTGVADQQVPDGAEEWFALLRSGELTAVQRAAFETWLAEGEAHRAAIDDLSRLWGSLDAVRDDPTVLGLREDALSARPVPRKRPWRALTALAAGLAAVAVVTFQLHGSWRARPDHGTMMNYTTRVGEKATLHLPDGTLLVLDTDSALQVRFSAGQRQMELARGRAFFNVAKDPVRPFSVRAAGNTVTALGTQFAVELAPYSMDVTLLSGRLRVRGADGGGAATEPSIVELSAGQRMSVTPDGKWALRPLDQRVDTSWLRGQLVFDEATLADIAAALNRYSARKVEIAAPAIASRHMSAVLQAGDVDTFVRAAESLGLARRGNSDSDHVVLVAP